MEALRMAVIMAGPINILLMVVVLTAQDPTVKSFTLGLQLAILAAQVLGIVILFTR